MRKRGYVKGINGDTIDVVVIRDSACGGNCSTCGSCDSEPIDISLRSKKKHQIGDIVDIEIEEKSYFKIGFLMYILPLIVFVLVFFVSSSTFKIENELTSVLVSFLFMFLTYLILRTIDKKVDTNRIIKLVED